MTHGRFFLNSCSWYLCTKRTQWSRGINITQHWILKQPVPFLLYIINDILLRPKWVCLSAWYIHGFLLGSCPVNLMQKRWKNIYERAGSGLESMPAWQDGCHKFMSDLSVMFSSPKPEPVSSSKITTAPQLPNICGYQQTMTAEIVKRIRRGPTNLWLSQRHTLCVCGYANIYLNSH